MTNGTLYREVSAAQVDVAEKAAAATVLDRVSMFLGLVQADASGWRYEPSVALKWFDAADPDRPPGRDVETFRMLGVGCFGMFDVDTPNVIWIRAGVGTPCVVESVAHELRHRWQLKNEGRGGYVARFRAGLIEDDAHDFGDFWRGYYARHPLEFRRDR